MPSLWRDRRSDPWMALDAEKFECWQPNLLALLNDPKLARFGRWRLGLNRHVGRDEEILNLSPHHFTVRLRGDQFRSTFMSQPALQKGLYRAFTPVFWGMHAYDWVLDRTAQRWIQSLIRPMRPAFGLNTLTAYPQAGGGGSNVTCDGFTYATSGSVTFAVLHASAGNTSEVTYTSNVAALDASATTNQFAWLSRVFASFDTSALGASATISGGILSLWGSLPYNGLGSTDLVVVASTQAAANNLTATDHSAVGSTSFGSFPMAGWSNVSYNDATLNSSGLAAISKIGVTKLAFRLGWDQAGSFTGTWAQGASSMFTVSMADSPNAPKLVVTYTLPFVAGPVARPYTQAVNRAAVY